MNPYNALAKSSTKPQLNVLQKLAAIQIGGSSARHKIHRRDLIFILRNLATLTENGLSLPASLKTIVREKSLRAYFEILNDICRTVENGETFSGALAKYKTTFSEVIVAQVRIGERSGTLPDALGRIVNQLEHADTLKSTIIKKLSYPALLCVAGSGAITFMLLFVVPTFEKTYKESGATLPAITQFFIAAGHFGTNYGWIFVAGFVATIVGWIIARRNPVSCMWIDRNIIRLPLLGDTLKNMAVLQFMEVLGNLMEAGFTVADALASCAKAVSNSAIRKCVEDLRSAVLRGERFSSELEHQGDLFPPIVNQLIIVGEKTGTLPKAARIIRDHLRREVDRTLGILIGAIEPIMTILLAIAIGCILLAIYLPMFDMIGSMKTADQK